MPVDTTIWRHRIGVSHCFFQRRFVRDAFRHASPVTTCASCTGSSSSRRLAVYLALLLLCAGVEPNPGPTNAELAAKIDTFADEVRALHKATIDRLDILSRDVNNRITACEESITALKSDVD